MSSNSVYNGQYRILPLNYISQDPYDSTKLYEQHRDLIREKVLALPNSPRSKLKIEKSFDDLLDYIHYSRKLHMDPYPYYTQNHEQIPGNFDRKYQELLELLEKEKNFRLSLESENNNLKARIAYFGQVDKQYEDYKISAMKTSKLQNEIDQLNIRVKLLVNENEDLRRGILYNRENTVNNRRWKEELEREVLKNQGILRELKDFKAAYEELRLAYACDANNEKEKYDNLYGEKIQVESLLRDLNYKYKKLLNDYNCYRDSGQQYRNTQRSSKESGENQRDPDYKEDFKQQDKEPDKMLKASVNSSENSPKQIEFYERSSAKEVKPNEIKTQNNDGTSQKTLLKTYESTFHNEKEQDKPSQKPNNKSLKPTSKKPNNHIENKEIQENIKKIPTIKQNSVPDTRIKEIEERLYSLQEKLSEQTAVNQKILKPNTENPHINLAQTLKCKNSNPIQDKNFSPYATCNSNISQKSSNRRNSARKNDIEIDSHDEKKPINLEDIYRRNSGNNGRKSKIFTSREDFYSCGNLPLSQSKNYENAHQCKTCARKHGEDWARSSSKL
ncbi:hypothetical protein SteCoe_35023 [Stentor coeruleus]|uniref:Uncharacterized protein n=1 Tax=Stentor coeruleus TaxID=5963 RepID=A0A1R2ATK1_9CILI|nr:hypothetical protein SteCoe_35023 [Stentor coeruleus]